MLKLRKLLIIIVSVLILITFTVISSISYKMGMNYGEKNAEGIRIEKAKNIDPHEKLIKSVRVKTIKETSISTNIKSSGRVVSVNNITLSSEVQGTLIGNYSFKKGSKIEQGDTIFTIKDTDLKLLIKAKKSRFMNLVSNTLIDIKLDFNSEYTKWNSFFKSISLSKGLPSLPKINDSKEKNFIISRSVLSEYLSIKSDEERLKKYTAIAPFDGVVTRSYTDVGANVNPGSPIVDFIRTDQMEVELSIPTEKIDLINIGDKVTLEDHKNTFEGRIIRKGNFVNSSTQNFSVFVKVKSEQEKLYSGMYLKANISTKQIDNVSRIPRRAVFGNNNIYILNSSNQLITKTVEIISSENNDIIVNNLPENTIVVIEPIIHSKEKMVVHPIK